jgi:CRISPR-associated protein Csb2
MLALEVAFLTGRYVATAYNTRSEAEWPPHPARLFSALAASHFALDPGEHGRDEERAVLEWLERQGPPSIAASDAATRDVVTVFVPVNDVALTNVDDEAARLEDARSALEQAQAAGDAKHLKKCTTAVSKAEATLQKAIARETGVPKRSVHPRYGRRVLPDHRTRQPRTFPSVAPANPRVTYVWPDATPSDPQRAQLDRLLRRVVRLGHSSSLVSVRLVDTPPDPNWRPAEDGEEVLRVVQDGQLVALEHAYALHRETEPRVMPAIHQRYTKTLQAAVEDRPVSVFSDGWLVFRRIDGPSLSMTSAIGVAQIMRKALLSYSAEPIPEILSGHAPAGGPSQRPHVAIVPLPFVGHPHASGAILGIAVVLPRDSRDEERRAVYQAVYRWETERRQDDEDTPALRLNLGASGELALERIEWGLPLASLRAETWCGPGRVWSSVTPVALDRNPGDLRSRDPRKLGEAVVAAQHVVARACERIGLPRPASVEILPAAPWAGASKARHYPSFPSDASRTQRVLTHVRIDFGEMVCGPVLIGAGRYLGLGLLRPEVQR